jgi:uncharacterized membrane protein
MLDFLRFHESHPPLFYVLVRLWTSAVGDTDRLSILPPVVIGVALIPTTFLVGRSLFSLRVGLIAAALVTLSPTLVEYSATMRPYSLLPFLALVSVYALTKATHQGSIKMWVAYTLLTIVLLYTHNWAWLILFGEWVAVVAAIAFRKSRKRFLGEWAIAQSIIGAAYSPWLSTFVYQAKHAGHGPAPVDISSDFTFAVVVHARKFLDSTILAPAQFSTQQSDTGLAWLFATPVLFLMVMQFLFARAASSESVHDTRTAEPQSIAMKYLVIIPLTTFVVALVLSPRTELLLPRCVAAVAPLLLLGMANWLSRARGRLASAVGAVTIAVFIATYIVSLGRLLPTSRSNARELARAIASRTEPEDLVVVVPDWLASSFNRYYEPDVEQIDYPELYREGAIDFTGFLKRFQNQAPMTGARLAFKAARERNRRVWLVLDVRKIRPQSAAKLTKLLGSNSYGLVSFARAAQLRLSLDTLYGPPDTLVVTGGRVQRNEALTALLYSAK